MQLLLSELLEAFDNEGSGDNEEGYNGDLQYEEKSEELLEYSGDGFILVQKSLSTIMFSP